MSISTQALAKTVAELTAPGKGILAADESTGTIEKRLKAVNAAGTASARMAGDAGRFIGALRDVLCAATICTHTQGLSLLGPASLAYFDRYRRTSRRPSATISAPTRISASTARKRNPSTTIGSACSLPRVARSRSGDGCDAGSGSSAKMRCRTPHLAAPVTRIRIRLDALIAESVSVMRASPRGFVTAAVRPAYPWRTSLPTTAVQILLPLYQL